jgi:alpha-tubulin suppressor-like RCC1 family protein
MNNHSFIYYQNSELWCFGANNYGQLGLGHIINIQVPVLCMIDPNIKQISCGFEHTLILKILPNGTNELWGFGSNINAQLGSGSYGNWFTMPKLIMSTKERIRHISAGKQHSLILKQNCILSCGKNAYGCLGQMVGTDEIVDIFTPGIEANDIKFVQAGPNTSTYVRHRSIYGFGNNDFLQLGKEEKMYPLPSLLFTFSNDIQKVICSIDNTIVLTTSELWYSGYITRFDLQDMIRNFTCISKENDLKIIDVSSGSAHYLILKEDVQGKQYLYSFGFNTEGQLGIGNKTSFSHDEILIYSTRLHEKITSISCGQNHSMFLKSNVERTNHDIHHSVWIFGNNKYRCKIGVGFASCLNQYLPKRLDIDNKLVAILNHGGIRPVPWTIEIHNRMPHTFQKVIYVIYSCLKRVQIRLPKYVIYLIVQNLQY